VTPRRPTQPPRAGTAPSRAPSLGDPAAAIAEERGPRSLVAPASQLQARPPARPRRIARALAAAALDAVLILVGFTIAYWLRYRVDWPPPFEALVRGVPTEFQQPLSAFLPYALLLTGLLLALFAMKGLYRLPRTAGLFDSGPIILGSVTTGVAVLIVAVFIYRYTEFYSRLIFAFAWAVIVLLLCGWRAVLVNLRRLQWMRGIGQERVLVVGGRGVGRSVMEGIVAHPFLGYALAGYLDDRPPPVDERRNRHFRRLGELSDLAGLLAREPIDLVILALPFWEHRRLPELVEVCRDAGVEFRVAPDLHQLSFDRVDVGNLGGTPLIGLKELSIRGWNLVLKRALDVGLVLLAAPLALPLAGLLALAIRLDSPGPVIFRQTRIGKGGRPFTTYKFRTMSPDAEARKAELAALNEADGPIFKIRNDPRVTRVGRVLRRTSLDELPQLWNILRGEMSLVGPRPPTPDEVAQYEHWHLRRLEVTPGLTGLWQVLGRSDTSFDEMVRLDIYYAENWSLGLDIRIVLQTIPVVLLGRGAY
jgi:exopolysaccharide biosynthesis polyprenyl glycosylphosphotransferase